MSKRKTLADQVGEQAALINDLQSQLATTKTDLALIEQNFQAREQAITGLNVENSVLNQGLDDLREQLSQSKSKVQSLEKELESSKSMQRYYQGQSEEPTKELEQIHAIIDGIEGAPERTYQGRHGEANRTAATRVTGALLLIARGDK